MKKIKINSKLLLVSLVSVVFLGFTSCNYNKTADNSGTAENRDPGKVAEDHNEAKFDNNQEEKDADFLVDAAEMNLEEISIAKLAQERATSTQVKELAKELQTHHQKALDELNKLAKNKMITIPTSLTDDGQDNLDKLRDKSGNDFDKEFADLMVKRHKDAIQDFEKISDQSSDSEIKSWANSNLPQLRSHLDKSMAIQKQYDKI